MSKLYYTAPSDECFEELRKEAMTIWYGYDDTYKYATGKINRIKDIKNVEDNFMYMVAMFDRDNQVKLSKAISEETRTAVRERLLDGGAHYSEILF